MNEVTYRQAAENIAGEPVSIEPDGSVWADSDHRDIDEAAVQAEYERLIADRAAARAALLVRLGITEDEAALLREAGI
jgi:hypothetical protein